MSQESGLPDPDQVINGPHEIIRHALGPKDPKGGMYVDPEEERRRQVALNYELKRIAPKQGLDIRPAQPFPVDEQPSTLVAEVTSTAAPMMEKASAGALVQYDHRRRVYADGSTDEATRLQVNVFAPIVSVLNALGNFVRNALKGKLSFSAKVGRHGAQVKVDAEASQD